MRNIKKLLISVFTIVIVGTFSCIYGATNISVSNNSPKPGDTITVTVKVSGVAAWDVHVTASGPVTGSTINLVGDDANGKNVTTSASGTFKVTGEGNITFATTSSSNGTTQDGTYGNVAGSKTITSKTPVVNPPNNGGTETPVTKSSNNYLKSLQVNVEGLSPRFVKTKTSYTLSIGQDVNSIKVTAATEDSKAKFSVTGNTNFKDGDNVINIKVTAENGNTKTYKIVATRSSDPEKANAYLENLVIENVTLSPEFSSEILEYDCGKVAASVNKLNILTFAKNEKAKVEILGNENLVEGENIIKIKITAEDGVTTKEYILKVSKEAGVSEGNTDVEIYKDEDISLNIKREENGVVGFFKGLWSSIKANALLVIMYLLVIVEFVEIVYLYNKLRNKDVVQKENNKQARRGRRASLENSQIEEIEYKEEIVKNEEELNSDNNSESSFSQENTTQDSDNKME